MGRKKSSGEKQEKKTAVKLRAIPRKHAGKITEPWAIMERLVAECEFFAHLKIAKIKLWWQKDWKVDVDGIATGAQCSKANERDRILAEEATGETVDLFINLPETQWVTLDDREKERRIFHELCHFKPANDANGRQKQDSKDRLLWRMGRHPITAFPEEIDRFGVDDVLGANAKIVEAIRHAERPMEKLFEEAEKSASGKKPGTPDNAEWRKCRVAVAGFTEKQVDALEAAGLLTLGELQDAMNRHGEWWAKTTGVSGRMRQKIEDAFNDYLIKFGDKPSEAA